MGLHRALKRKYRRLFSLMEVMIVMVLVSLVAGITVYSIIPLYRTFCFQTEVSTVYDLMQELQLEALTLQSDMQLTFTKKKGKWSATTLSEETVLRSQHVDLSHIAQIHLDQKQQDRPFTLIFYSNGLVKPPAVMLLSNPHEKRWIDFAHPPLLKLHRELPKKFESLSAVERSNLRSEIKEKK
jgi:hypothetical protein